MCINYFKMFQLDKIQNLPATHLEPCNADFVIIVFYIFIQNWFSIDRVFEKVYFLHDYYSY
jgi:hypothetical protein